MDFDNTYPALFSSLCVSSGFISIAIAIASAVSFVGLRSFFMYWNMRSLIWAFSYRNWFFLWYFFFSRSRHAGNFSDFSKVNPALFASSSVSLQLNSNSFPAFRITVCLKFFCLRAAWMIFPPWYILLCNADQVINIIQQTNVMGSFVVLCVSSYGRCKAFLRFHLMTFKPFLCFCIVHGFPSSFSHLSKKIKPDKGFNRPYQVSYAQNV